MPRVIVVGGGLAGLSAALRLQDAGADVRVLEANPRPGGRVTTIRHDGWIVDTGLQFIGPCPPYDNTFALIERLGLLPDLRRGSPGAALVKKGRVLPYRYGSATDFLKFPALSLSSKLRLLSVLPEINRYLPLLDFHHPERSESLDDQDITEYVPQIAGRDVLDHLIQPLMGVFYYYPPAGVSRAFLLIVVSSVGGLSTQCLRGGNDVLTDQLSAQVKVSPGSKVRRVSASKGKPTVHWTDASGDHRASPDAVILAVPADIAADLCGDLTPEESDFLRTVQYSSCIGIASGTDRPFGDQIYGTAIAPDESPLLTGITFEQNKCLDRVPEGRGLSIAFLNAASAAALMAAGDKEIVAQVQLELNRLWPGHADSTLWSLVFRAARATPIFQVGYLKRLQAFLDRAERTRGIAFAGDYLCGPHAEGAITSGIRAAETLLSDS